MQDDANMSVATDLSPRIHDQDNGPQGPNQETGTCYAFAAATAIRSAQMRIFGRAVERHESLVRQITDRFGCDGAPINDVLSQFCPQKNLYYEAIGQETAESLLQASGRVVLARFDLTESMWDAFTAFFLFDPSRVLQASDLSSDAGFEDSKVEGHAVVITGQTQDAWLVKNSWGEGFGDDGYFRVARDALNFKYYDVCFRLCDLNQCEINAYRLAPPVLKVRLDSPQRSVRNPISSLGWSIDFETFRIERVRRRNCAVATWNRQHPYEKIQPGYQIHSVNGVGMEASDDMCWELHNSDVLDMMLVICKAARLDDVFDERARPFSYAHAIATAIRKTQARIFCREVEHHEDIVNELLTEWGTDHVDIPTVLDQACRSRNLHFSPISANEAACEVSMPRGRHILATFSLDVSAWRRFENLFDQNPDAVLTAADVQNDLRMQQQAGTVLVGGLNYLEGWGSYWRIQDPLMLSRTWTVDMQAVSLSFYDVYFYLEDLSSQEVRLFQGGTQ